MKQNNPWIKIANVLAYGVWANIGGPGEATLYVVSLDQPTTTSGGYYSVAAAVKVKGLPHAAITPRPLPAAGDVVFNAGYEFTVTDPTVETNPDGRKVFRYTGVCTASDRNNSIRNTAYNGGRYGWAI